MASVHRDPRGKSPYWYAYFTDANGKRCCASTKETDKGKAKLKCAQWRDAALALRKTAVNDAHAAKVMKRILKTAGRGGISTPVVIPARDTEAKRVSQRTIPASTVDCRQKDRLWTLARQIGNPSDVALYMKGWAETAKPVGIPERIIAFTRDSRLNFVSQRPACHHRFVLIIVLKGAGQICIDERIFRLDAGQAFLIFPFQFHHYISFQGSSRRWIFIMFEVSRADSLEPLRNQPWRLTPAPTQILHDLLKVVSSRNSTVTIRAAEAQLLLARFLDQSSIQGMRPPPSLPSLSPQSAEFQKLLDRIHNFLDRNIHQSFKLEDIARGIGCSRSHLRHQFKEHFSTNLGRYVARRRLNRAMGLLRENSMNVSGVAEACGYSSVFVFSRTFHAATGCSPLQYRIQFNKGDAK